MKGRSGERTQRVVKRGVVVGLSGDKTVAVQLERVAAHPLYKKLMRRRTRLLVHDEEGRAKAGDEVEIMESRPLSKRKHWRLVKVVGKASGKVTTGREKEGITADDPGAEPAERS